MGTRQLRIKLERLKTQLMERKLTQRRAERAGVPLSSCRRTAGTTVGKRDGVQRFGRLGFNDEMDEGTSIRSRRTLPDRIGIRDGPQVRAFLVTCNKGTDALPRQQATGIREGEGIPLRIGVDAEDPTDSSTSRSSMDEPGSEHRKTRFDGRADEGEGVTAERYGECSSLRTTDDSNDCSSSRSPGDGFSEENRRTEFDGCADEERGTDRIYTTSTVSRRITITNKQCSPMPRSSRRRFPH